MFRGCFCCEIRGWCDCKPATANNISNKALHMYPQSRWATNESIIGACCVWGRESVCGMRGMCGGWLDFFVHSRAYQMRTCLSLLLPCTSLTHSASNSSKVAVAAAVVLICCVLLRVCVCVWPCLFCRSCALALPHLSMQLRYRCDNRAMRWLCDANAAAALYADGSTSKHSIRLSCPPTPTAIFWLF